MTFDWLRLRHPGPTRDARGQHHPQRPPQAITRAHGKRPGFIPPAVAHLRRGHHRDQHQSSSAPAPRAPPPMRKGPVVRPPVRPPARPPARPHPPQRSNSKLLQCLHIHFHPSQKRDAALHLSRPVRPPIKPPMRPPVKAPVKPMKPTKHISSQQVPPFPPPRGAVKPPPRHVHWAPAQAPLPYQPYPYPSHNSSSTPSHATSHARSQPYVVPPPIPRYQPPRQSRGAPQQLHKRK